MLKGSYSNRNLKLEAQHKNVKWELLGVCLKYKKKPKDQRNKKQS